MAGSNGNIFLGIYRHVVWNVTKQKKNVSSVSMSMKHNVTIVKKLNQDCRHCHNLPACMECHKAK